MKILRLTLATAMLVLAVAMMGVAGGGGGSTTLGFPIWCCHPEK